MLRKIFASSKIVAKIKIQGPLDSKLQQNYFSILPKINLKTIQAFIVIVNSRGGSLSVAKNISDSLKLFQKQRVPVYCFAEQFCLNSANLILTSGTQCYANKLSVIGDFGCQMQRYSGEILDKKYKIGRELIGSIQKPIDGFLQTFQINDTEKSSKIVQELANTLKKEVISNREAFLISKKGLQNAQKWLHGGSLNPRLAAQMGLIDGLHTQNQFKCSTFLIKSNVWNNLKWNKKYSDIILEIIGETYLIYSNNNDRFLLKSLPFCHLKSQ